eukprot:jgi/Psemu1/22081/gm1.22081_g
MIVTEEDSLWLLLAGSVPLLIPSIDDGVWHWEAWMHIGTSIGFLVFLGLSASSTDSSSVSFAPPKTAAAGDKKQKQKPKPHGNSNPTKHEQMGMTMSIVMVPVLLRLWAHHLSQTSNPQARVWTTYSKIATLLVIPTRNSISMLGCGI